MENSPLNKAHQLDRRAEALLKQKKFEESIECHANAVKHLYDALHLTENLRAKESIQLQIDCHQKQIESLRIKKSQYDDFRRYQDTVKNRAMFESIFECPENLHKEIFRTMECHDSLVGVFLNRNDDDLKSYTSEDETKTPSGDTCDGINISGRKHKVDDSVLLEEFRCLSEKLREFVEILVQQVADKDAEISKLKAEIYKLEGEKNKEGAKVNNTLKVITDSSGGTSPYVFSPCSELSPEVHDSRSLPALAPLEMPNFDFSSLVKNTNNLSINGTKN